MSTEATSGGAGATPTPVHSFANSSSVPSQEFVSTSPVTPGQPCGPGPADPSEYCHNQYESQLTCVVGDVPYCANHKRLEPKNGSLPLIISLAVLPE